MTNEESQATSVFELLFCHTLSWDLSVNVGEKQNDKGAVHQDESRNQ